MLGSSAFRDSEVWRGGAKLRRICVNSNGTEPAAIDRRSNMDSPKLASSWMAV